jgi:dihydroorotase
LQQFKDEYGDNIPIKYHPIIRSEEACYLSSSKAIALAKKTGARLHVFHLSTGKETDLFTNDIPMEQKKITAEVCIHHLWFSDEDYDTKGTLIKWNPAVKTTGDREKLLEEKENPYTKAPSGGPLVQHALPAMLQKFKEGKIQLETIVEKMCHNPAKLFDIEKRGFVREGFFADLVEVDLNSKWEVNKSNILYKCGWSPFEGAIFNASVKRTFINGHLAYENGQLSSLKHAKRLTFNR